MNEEALFSYFLFWIDEQVYCILSYIFEETERERVAWTWRDGLATERVAEAMDGSQSEN